MKIFREWLEENRPDVKIPEEKEIPMTWFDKHNLPMIVACTCCQSTMVIFSALIDDDGHIYCSNCAGEDQSSPLYIRRSTSNNIY